ncbi:MAG: hypothetical protein QXE01_03465 [Sulfolobales archaeon]
MVLVVRGYVRSVQDAIAIEVKESDLWGDIAIPRDSRATGLAISTPHGCVIVIGVDIVVEGERVLLASFLDPLDKETLRIIEQASLSRRLAVMLNGRIVGLLNLSDEDMGKMEYVASKTRECSQIQNKPVNLDLAAQWFLENFNL